MLPTHFEGRRSGKVRDVAASYLMWQKFRVRLTRDSDSYAVRPIYMESETSLTYELSFLIFINII